MSYEITLVHCEHLTDTVQVVGASGLPTVPFDFFLFSCWACLGPPPNTRIVGLSNLGAFGGISIDHTKVRVLFRAGVSIPIMFDGSFNCSPANVLTHVLVSLSPLTSQVQVYVKDVPLSLSSGGWTGQPVGPFNIPVPASQWVSTSAGSTSPGPGAGDMFAAAPSSFYDLTITANRRKFIHASLTPVDLGDDASSVLGTAPAIYLTIRPGGVAPDFATNNGSGGPWTVQVPPLTLQVPGSCVVATPPVIPKLAMDNVVVTIEPDLSLNLIWLSASDDRGHSFGSPVSQSIGDIGEYRTSLSWRRLGMARDRVFRLEWSAPTATALQGCWLEVTPAES